ncbi:hypothetical protein [Intestinibacter bartlettii]|uniref:hypothetical protein n=1 Tax=Intestinibacter bartlettii TaxID=261299 RepID=UPI0034AD03D4
MYTWNKNWILKYQSIWCTIEKIKFSNYIDGISLKKYLHSSLRKNVIYDVNSLYISNYKFDKDILIDLCEKDIFKNINHELKKILGFIYNICDIEKYIISDFRFCPYCIKTGYHSIFHQLNLFDKCIFHNISLEYKCSNCNKINSYCLKYDNSFGFICNNCGFNYLETTDFLKLINIWNSQYLNSKFDIDKYLYNFKYKCFFTSLEFYLNKYVYKSSNYYLKDNTFIYKFLNSKLKRNYLYKFKPTLNGVKFPIYNYESIYDSPDYIFIDRYIVVLKSIARHFRKKIKKKNYKFYYLNYLFFNHKSYRENYKLLIDKTKYKGIDEYLYTYIVWRKFAEGLNNYTEVDSYNFFNKKTRKENISNSLFYKYINHELKNYIWTLKNNKDYDGFDDIGILLSSLERIIGDILIDYFNSCLKFVRNKKNFNPDQIISFNCDIDIKFSKYFIYYDKDNRVGYIIKN